MAEITGISWTDHTHSIAWGCNKISPGCKFCYADDWSARFGNDVWGLNKPRKKLSNAHWAKPKKWNKACAAKGTKDKVFSSSMCDNFEDHPTIAEELLRLWALIKETPNLEWQLLTKRADRIKDCLPPDWGDGYPNVWLGVSVENDDYCWRVDALREIPAKIRFISYEPAIGPVPSLNLDNIHWLIFGGESGENRRPMKDEWAVEAMAKCREKEVAFFFKQHSALKSGVDCYLNGVEYKEFPLYEQAC